MNKEIYCDACRGFQPLITDSFSILCGNCQSTVAHLNTHGQFLCDDCSGWQKPEYEELHRPLPEDSENEGYLVADVCCSKCRSILLVIREPASEAAPSRTASR